LSLIYHLQLFWLVNSIYLSEPRSKEVSFLAKNT
jgi:hypothetical protein